MDRVSIVSIILVLLTLVGCQNKEKIYYETGELKFFVDLVNNKREGISYEYYENGEIMSIQYWKNGLSHGEAKHFFPSGNLELINNWKEGELHGKVIEYYESGQVKSEGICDHGIRIGEFKFYYENGQIMEIDFFDSTGRLYDYLKLDTLGGIRDDKKAAITSLSRDTIKLGEVIVLTGYLGNNEHKVYMLVGTKFNEEGFVADTLAIVEPQSGNDGCIFKYTPEEKGENYLVGFIQDVEKVLDGYNVQVYPFAEKFFVKK